MPRHVDHAQRKADIIAAALAIIASDGLAGLSFRAIAERLGGSPMMVTHYYASRQALLDHLAEDLIAGWERTVAEIEEDEADPQLRLRRVLEWALPLQPASLVEEQAWANLRADPQERPAGMIEVFDERMRRFISDHLIGVVPEARISPYTDYLRTVTSGIVSLTVAMPGAWPAERQLAVLHLALEQLDLRAAV